MTTKEWLNRAWDINGEIGQLLEEQENAFSRAQGGNYVKKRINVQHNRTNNTEKNVTTYLEYTESLDKKIDELYSIKREVILAIWQVKDRQLRMLLFARYIQFKTWEQIAELLHKSDVKWVRTGIHSKALKSVEEVFK